MSDIEAQIKNAELAAVDARAAAEKAESHLNALYVQRSFEKFGIQIGQRVRDRKGREIIIAAIRPDSWASSMPWVYGKKIKKDGMVGDQTITFYGDYEIVPPP